MNTLPVPLCHVPITLIKKATWGYSNLPPDQGDMHTLEALCRYNSAGPETFKYKNLHFWVELKTGELEEIPGDVACHVFKAWLELHNREEAKYVQLD